MVDADIMSPGGGSVKWVSALMRHPRSPCDADPHDLPDLPTPGIVGKPLRTCHSMVSSAPDAASAALVSGYIDSANDNELCPEVEYDEAASASRLRGGVCFRCADSKPAWNEDASVELARHRLRCAVPILGRKVTLGQIRMLLHSG